MRHAFTLRGRNLYIHCLIVSFEKISFFKLTTERYFRICTLPALREDIEMYFLYFISLMVSMLWQVVPAD